MSANSLMRRSDTPFVVEFTRADGSISACEIIELSFEGVALRADVALQPGEFVLIGQLAGRVARRYSDFTWIEFVGRESDSSLAKGLRQILFAPEPQS